MNARPDLRLRGLHRIASLLLLALASTAWIDAGRIVAADQGNAPNIVLVMADDLGYSDIGCFGGEIPTPAIDRLAREGMRFTQFYNNAICGPTRASLLTGLYCQQTGHRGDHWNDPKDYDRCVLAPELLQQAGYRNFMVGKWQGRDSALDRGFDRFFGPMCQGKVSYFHEVQKNPFYRDRQRWPLPADFYMTDAFNQAAVEFLEEGLAGEDPFFLYVAHLAPHWPLHAREEAIAQHRDRYRSLGWDQARLQRQKRQQRLGLFGQQVPLGPAPDEIIAWEKEPNPQWQAERMAVYAAQVASIDQGLEQLLAVLDRSEKKDNTLVLFLSDNGAASDGGLAPTAAGFGFSPDAANDRWRTDGGAIRPGSGPQNLPGPHDTFAGYGRAWATVSNTPLRGWKITAFEGGIRTPLLVRWPAAVKAGSQSNAVGHVFDFLPTFLELAGAAYPTEFQGRHPLPLEGASLVPLLRGEERASPTSLCWSLPAQEAIRAGKWKLIREKKSGEVRLFDLEKDPTETTDLAERHSQTIQQLERALFDWRERVGVR